MSNASRPGDNPIKEIWSQWDKISCEFLESGILQIIYIKRCTAKTVYNDHPSVNFINILRELFCQYFGAKILVQNEDVKCWWNQLLVAVVDRFRNHLSFFFKLKNLKLGVCYCGRCWQVVAIWRWLITQVWLYSVFVGQIDPINRQEDY